ncbi:hypothetical protein I4U23_008362 [Adineta vaga]|nr:hypothetical protein I4U23_008362 [Adineta vaga]
MGICRSKESVKVTEPVSKPATSHDQIPDLIQKPTPDPVRKPIPDLFPDTNFDSIEISIVESTNDKKDDEFIDIKVVDPEAFNHVFIPQREKKINKIAYRSIIESWQPKSLPDLADILRRFSEGKSIIDRHWFIYYWTAINIEYDTVSYFTKNYADQTAEGVFRTRKGVCAGYANIYKHLCDQMQIPCEIVGGYSKGYGFDDREGAPAETDHAWNAVEIYNHWYLLDSTWGAGHLNDEKLFERRLDTYYFLARPNEMIYHHLPKEEKWQLLETPIKMNQYMMMPKLRPLYFEYGLEIIQPRNQGFVHLEPEKPYALVILKTSLDISLMAHLKRNDRTVEGGDSVIFDKRKRVYNCYFAPASTGDHKISIYAKRGNVDVDVFNPVLDLTFKVKEMPINPISYPRTWKLFYDLGMKVLSPLGTHFIDLNNGEKSTQITISTPSDVELIGKLETKNEQTVSCGDRVYYDRQKDCWRCKFAPDADGIFNAIIFAKKKTDSGKYQSAISFKIHANHIPLPPFSFPKTWQLFYDFDLKILSPVSRGIIVVREDKPFVEVRIKAPLDIDLSCQLKNNRNEKLLNSHKIYYDRDNDIWRCTFAPNENGMFEGYIYAKRKSDSGNSSSVVSYIIDARQLSFQKDSLLDTTQLFYDLNLEVLSPEGGSKILLSEEASFIEICLKTPSDVELMGELQNRQEKQIEGGSQVYYDRRQGIWHCRFAPNEAGFFDALILAKKSDDGFYYSVVTYHLEANHIRKPPLSFPKTSQPFYNFDLKIKSPRSRATAIWSENACYSEVHIQAPDHIELSCAIKYNDGVIENGSLAQYNHEKKFWQLLFAPEHTGKHELFVYARKIDDKDKSANVVVMFPLNVTHFQQAMKFPFTYTKFQTTKCCIYTPLYKRLKKHSVVRFHCYIPDAVSVTMTNDSRMLREEGFANSILQRQITVGSEDVTICAKYGQNPHYSVLIKYIVE